jgi:hypothetical protein
VHLCLLNSTVLGFEIVSEVLRRNEPLIGMVLWIASDHVSESRRTSIRVGLGYTHAVQGLAWLIGAQLSNLFSSVFRKAYVVSAHDRSLPTLRVHGRKTASVLTGVT